MKLVERFPTTRAESNSWAHTATLVPSNMATMVAEADASSMQRLRERAKEQDPGATPSYTALVIKAAALTMAANPAANRAILGFPFFKKLYQFHTTDISVAVEKSLFGLPGQAYAQPIRDTLGKSTKQITADLKALVHCTEANNEGFRRFMRILKYLPHPLAVWALSLPHWIPSLWAEHHGSACWVNAPSKAGADLVMTTWPWPITFSFGVVRKRPAVVGDRVEARLTMPLVMVFDRRIMGGGPAGRIFAQFKYILENADEQLDIVSKPDDVTQG